MCKFISWVQKGDKAYFLTYHQLFETEKGKELLVGGVSYDDACGHGTIRLFYGLERDEGVNMECSNFSSPANFPPEIVKAIKEGKMRGMGVPVPPLQMLTQQAFDSSVEWKKAHVELNKARVEWSKANAESDKADAEWYKTRVKSNKARADWYKADAEWYKARAEWNKAHTEWKKAYAAIFWDLFAEATNRVPTWV